MSVDSDHNHQVTLDDQSNINEFSKLNWKLTKLEEQLKVKRASACYVAITIIHEYY